MAAYQNLRAQVSHQPSRSHCPIAFPLVSDIETTAKRFVGIESKCTNENMSKCHRQSQSPLFCIPAELRNLIYDYASLPDVHPSKRRCPPHCITLACHSFHTNLSWLQVCRLIWLEANAVVFKYAEPLFFRLYEAPDLQHFMRNLTPLNVEYLQRIHIGQEVFNLALDPTVLKYLEDTTLQLWPPEVTITLTAYPCFSSTEDVSDWIMQILTHQKFASTDKLQINIHVAEHQVRNIQSIAEVIRRERRIGDWEPLSSNKREEVRWLRQWGDSRPRFQRGSPVNMAYRTFNIDFRRAPGTGKVRLQKYEPGMDTDCWHLMPWRTIFPQSHPCQRTFSAQDLHAERYLRKWQAEDSLLKFVDE
ncbi:uncharacterized protein CLAFUR5_12555 [Fulvia fulva]|uniref:F-box domain-containing protein n=1 Tax=Passalora fulva TaxID=5499 RepID=A0A9Q8UV58_PASFU|nr:uncharacterized protein CLAFUR5_12555 [Fulvia fulva]KAK4612737.1 hypothetical protein CLAFUR0_12701 [Fulvia fulva]UJO23517.1 hypothetical protein CLAFUR5_12555 [Fulvia fulva]WPV36588.1 hypothetical protein CLAFUW7_12697 [Fulvia fulva]